jgi:hypothetical protein
MSVQRNLTDQEYELLSAYLDGALSEGERASLEARLTADNHLRQELQALRQTITLVKNMPMLRAPRDYTLTAEMVRPPRWIIFPTTAAFSALSAAAAMLLIFIGATLLLNQNSQAVFNSTSSNFQQEQDTQSQIAAQPTVITTSIPEQAEQPADIVLASATPFIIGGEDGIQAYDDGSSTAATLTSDSFALEFAAPGTATQAAGQLQFSPAVPQPTQLAEPAEPSGVAGGTTAQESIDESEAANAPSAAMADSAAQVPTETKSSEREAVTVTATLTLTSTPSPTASYMPSPSLTPTETLSPTSVPPSAPVPQVSSGWDLLAPALLLLGLVLLIVAGATTWARKRR